MLGADQHAGVRADETELEPSLTAWLRKNHGAMMAACSREFIRMPLPLELSHASWRLPMDAVLPLVRVINPALLPPGISTAFEARRHSFLAGRLCAERCIEELGVQPQGVGRDPSGSPVWPEGVKGSITHTAHVAHAISCSGPSLHGMGIDSEPFVDGEQALAIEQHCCTVRERAVLASSEERQRLLTLIFCAKEAFYKAIYAQVRRYVDFLDVELKSVDWRQSLFVIEPLASGPFAGVLPTLQGHFVIDGSQLHAAVLYRR
jgi:enterobactin synthetase component D